MSAEGNVVLWTEESSDAELIAGVRAGESAAFAILYERHGDAARRVAAMYTASPSDVDDVVAEAFARVLKALQQGSGPDLAFRAYLFTVVRRTGLDLINKGKRIRPEEDLEVHSAALGFEAGSDEPTLDNFEQGVIADAYRSLPERWQVVLWYTEIEGKSPSEIATVMGLTPNGVAALAYRAREALRQGYLQQHLSGTDDIECLDVADQLGSYVRGGLTKRETAHVDKHVEQCETCRALVKELEDVNHGLRGVIAPIVLGVLGTGALETALPIVGSFAGATSASSTAGTLGAGSSASGVGGSASAVGIGVGGLGGVFTSAAASGSTALTGVAATIGVGAMTVATIGVVGNLDAIETPYNTTPPAAQEEPSSSTSGSGSDSLDSLIFGSGPEESAGPAIDPAAEEPLDDQEENEEDADDGKDARSPSSDSSRGTSTGSEKSGDDDGDSGDEGEGSDGDEGSGSGDEDGEGSGDGGDSDSGDEGSGDGDSGDEGEGSGGDEGSGDGDSGDSGDQEIPENYQDILDDAPEEGTPEYSIWYAIWLWLLKLLGLA